METPTLKAHKRDVVGKKVAKLRKEGKVPAVIYGHGVEAQNLLVDAQEFRRVFDTAGESTIIALNKGDQEPVNVLIHNYQVDSLSSEITHVDFFQIRMDEEIHADIALEFIGESPAVKEMGGVLIKNIEALGVTCLPKDLLNHIDVDLSVLKTFEDSISIADLNVPEALTLDIDEETTVATVAPPRTTEELEALDEEVTEDVSAVEGVEKDTDDDGDADDDKKDDDKKGDDKKDDAQAAEDKKE